MTFASDVPKRQSFKKMAPEHDLSCNIRKGDIYFSRKNIFSRRKVKDDLSQKIHGNMTNISGTAKNDGAHPRKDDTGVLDQRSKKNSNNSLYLYG